MKLLRKALNVALAASLTWMPVRQAAAEDIDLFISSDTPAAVNPNVIIMLDNSANWSRADQNWPNNQKQGQSELRALKSVIGEVSDKINVGLMMFTEGQGSDPSGAYVRYHVRQMTTTNKLGFQNMIGPDSGCVAANPGPSLTPNCILQNYDNTVEKTGAAKTDYSAALFEAFKYLGGYTQPSLAQRNQAGDPVNASHFGNARYAGSPASSTAVLSRMDRAAYNEDARSTYNSPITSSLSCAKNYIIFIGNGFPVQDAPSTLLSDVNGSTTQLSMPVFNTGTSVQQEVVGTVASCVTVAACVTNAQTVAPAPNYSNWNCTGGTSQGSVDLATDNACKTASQCATDAAATYTTQYATYSCTGGTAGGGGAVSLGTDGACKTPAQCATDVAAAQPGFSPYSCTGGSTTSATTTTLQTDTVCRTPTACATAAATLYPGSDSYSCTGGNTVTGPGGCTGQNLVNQLMKGTLNACTGTSRRDQAKAGTAPGCTAPSRTGQTITGTSSACLTNQTMNASRSVITVTPTGTSAAPTTVRYTDEWAKYLNTTDVNSATGQQKAQVFAIDVFKDHQDVDQTALLLSMAKYGGGKYFQASNESAIINALRQIMIEIQSVNTVFAAASLPINATNRSQNENQVFIGMFRPDGNALPRWYGNLKRYQIALFGTEAKLADASTPTPQEAVSSTTGFIQPCAKSFWTSDSGTYWDFPNGSAGSCSTSGTSPFSDSPDGAQVEKGGAGEVVRKGNNPPTTDTTATNVVGRTLKTCTGACTSLVDFDSANVTQAMVGAADAGEHTAIINYTRGVDVDNDNTYSGNTDTRPSIHGDVAHSRPLPVNYGGTTGVMLYYGVNDGVFRAIRGADGKEVWGFIAPEHFTRLKRLKNNVQKIDFGQLPAPNPAPAKKDYFFDGTAGVYQTFNADNTADKVWIFPSMRRGGRMIYALDVSAPATPVLKWRVGCTDPSMTNTASCSPGFEQMGQTWSTPAVATVKGYTGGQDEPLVLVGGGYDTCEDTVPTVVAGNIVTACSSPKGNRVYVINANTGVLVHTFETDRSVSADLTLVDRDFDQRVDHAYVADMGGGLYRIDFVDPLTCTTSCTTRAETSWTITKIAQTSSTSGGGGRKFLFGPAALPATGKVFLAITSGDRERPLINNYPYVDDVRNRAYMLVDTFLTSGLPIDLDDTAQLPTRTGDNSCATPKADGTAGNMGWRVTIGGSVVGSQGEQGVTASAIFGGLIFFSTNRPLPVSAGSCDNNLGEAKGYALNLLNGSGAIGVGGLCGGTRSAVFTGGGLPPSPVTGTVPVGGKPVTVMIGGIDRTGASSSPIGAQKVKPVIAQKRSRVYWYRHGDK